MGEVQLVIIALRIMRKEEPEFQTSLVYMVNSRPTIASYIVRLSQKQGERRQIESFHNSQRPEMTFQNKKPRAERNLPLVFLSSYPVPSSLGHRDQDWSTGLQQL